LASSSENDLSWTRVVKRHPEGDWCARTARPRIANPDMPKSAVADYKQKRPLREETGGLESPVQLAFLAAISCQPTAIWLILFRPFRARIGFLFVEGNKIGFLGKHRSVEICHLERDGGSPGTFPLAATPNR
jgi:hypothetical protein